MRIPQGFWIILSYTAILLLSGFIGYKVSGSAISLVAGTSFAVLLLIALGGLVYQKRWGAPFLWVLMTLISSMFVVRGFMTHKPVPIFLAVLSVAVIVALLIRNPSSKS